MEEWKEYKLIDVLDKLIDYRGKTPKKTSSGVPLITAKIIKNGRIETPTEFISVEDYDSWMVRGFPKVGDVVLTTEAPLGEVAQLDNDNVALAQRVVTLRGKVGLLDNTYLKYYLMSNVGQQRLKARETGTTVTGIKQSELREVLVDCPPYEFQQKIASVLKSLDDKIEVNRQINDNLEQQAQAAFDELIMDEELPRTKFLKDYAFVNPSRTIKKGEVKRYIDMSSLPTQGSFPSDWINKPYNGGMKFQNGDTIMARITPCLENGKTAYINFLEKDEIAYGSTEYIVMTPQNGMPSEMFYFLARNEDFVSYAVAHMNGSSGRQRVSATDIENYIMPDIPTQSIELFGKKTNAVMECIKNNSFENRKLAILRDTLLPKLMSGELKVFDKPNDQS